MLLLTIKLDGENCHFKTATPIDSHTCKTNGDVGPQIAKQREPYYIVYIIEAALFLEP